MARKSFSSSKFSPAERRNWGFWDGRYDRERGRRAAWVKPSQSSGHPFDKPYGEGYWAGFYGDAHPNTEETP